MILGNSINPYFPQNLGLFWEHFAEKLKIGTDFAVERYNPKNAPALYFPTCLTTFPCSGTNRVPLNPITGQISPTIALLGGPSFVPGTGDPANGGLGGIFTKLIETIAKATPPARPTSLFSEAPQPATKPADQTRLVTIIRNTKEQAVQIETRTEMQPTNFAETDFSPINKNGN